MTRPAQARPAQARPAQRRRAQARPAQARPAQGSRAVAAAVWAVSWALAIASLVIAWRAGLPTEPLPGAFLSTAPLEMRSRFDDIGVTVALIYGPVAALILARRPHPVGVILAIHAVGSGLAAFGVQYGLLGATTPGLPLWGLLAFAAGWGFVPGTFMTAALPLLVTPGRPPRWQRRLVALCLVIAAAAFAASLTQQSAPVPRNPLAIDIPAYQAVLPAAYTVLSFAALAISAVSCAVLFGRWRRAGRRWRVSLAWLALGHLFLTLSYLALVLPDGLDLPPWVAGFGMIAPVLGQILYPAAILVVVLGQRLWGVEPVVSRLLLWSLLSFSGVALYLIVVAIVPAALPGVGLSLVAPVAVAMAVLPLRGWLQRRIDRLVYGEGSDPERLLARLGERIGELPPGVDGVAELAETLRRVLRLGWVEIRARELRVEAGRRTDAGIVRVPLTSGASVVGELSVRPVAGQRLDRRTLTVLGDVSGLVATIVRLVQSYLVLDAARDALVARRAAERRSIRRELHDGLGPALAGIGFGLAAAQNLSATHPRRAQARLHELADDVRDRVRDVRALADEVSVSPFDADELPRALAELARRFDAPSLRVRTDVAEPDGIRPRAAQALYFIAAEALANAARHARASAVSVRLGAVAGGVVLEISDDGAGIGAEAVPGVGMASMRERAEAENGVVEVTSDGGGTVVRARIPAIEDTRL